MCRPGAGADLVAMDLPMPQPAAGQVLVRVTAAVPVVTSVTRYPLAEANRVLADLRDGRQSGAAVLDCR